ncbi:hypothetical protein L596_007321 [Steinernema carpocapsae]|uniref:Uncharacterized protein n=1 Tax=Steinernema carpocapsae TaxID=34508 RepID=A0A4U5P9Y2_STECR|nr:hypothetical protein L596_007321 [Steinernema carpocapsae]
MLGTKRGSGFLPLFTVCDNSETPFRNVESIPVEGEFLLKAKTRSGSQSELCDIRYSVFDIDISIFDIENIIDIQYSTALTISKTSKATETKNDDERQPFVLPILQSECFLVGGASSRLQRQPGSGFGLEVERELGQQQFD